MHEIIIDM